MCCGRKRFPGPNPNLYASRVAGQASLPTPGNGPVFEYVGRTALTVVGPLTGIRYRFERPGYRVEVDPRDRQALAGVPVLRAVKARPT